MKVLLLIAIFVVLAQASQLHLKPAHVNPPIFFNKNVHKHSNNLKITGGEEVTPHSLPYQVGLFIPTDDGTAFCGGSLISPTTVLTAAHCGELSQNIEVILGAHRIRENEATQIRVNSSRVVVHPEWDTTALVNDIAIIRLPEPVELNENINVVKLPTDPGNNYLDDLATASGWGKDSDSAESISEVLRSVQIPVGENGVCNLYYLGQIHDSNICASGADGKSTCSGDSGGPLVASTGELIGITSFGIVLGCEVGWPPVFTRVTSYLDWIAQNSDVLTN